MKLSLSIVLAVALLIGTLILMTCSEDKPTEPINRAPSEPQMVGGPDGAPTNGAADVTIRPTLRWTCTDPEGSKLTYDVLLGKSATPIVVSTAQSGTSYSPATLDYSTEYYWRVVAKDPPGKSTSSDIWSFTTVAQSPHIVLDKTSLNYTAVRNGSLPGAQTFTLTNSGGGTLNWSVSDNADWLTMIPTSGVNNSATITVSVNSTNLSPTTHNGTITVSSTDADNSPQTIAVTYTVASSPHIVLDKSTLDYSAVENGSLPVSQTFAISNTGGGTLAWSASSNAGWLTVSPSSGVNNSATITVSVNTSNMSPSTYYGMITVSGNADNSPQTIAVEYMVNEPCFIIVMEPSAGEVQDVGSRFNILWTSSNAGLYVKFELYKGALLVGEISSSITNDGGGSWECNDFGWGGGPDYRIKVSSLSDPTCSGYSGFFTIIVPTQTVYIEFNTTSSGVSFSSNYWSGLIYFMHTDLAWRYAAPSWNNCGGSLILEGGTSDFDEITCVYPSECMICTDDGLTISSSCTSVSVAVRADLEYPIWSNVYTITNEGGGCKRSMSFNSSCVTRTTSISNSCLATTGRTRLNICQEDFLPVGDTEAAIESIRYTFNGWRVPAKAAPFKGEVVMAQGAHE